jgi:hypothetical protein
VLTSVTAGVCLTPDILLQLSSALSSPVESTKFLLVLPSAVLSSEKMYKDYDRKGSGAKKISGRDLKGLGSKTN